MIKIKSNILFGVAISCLISPSLQGQIIKVVENLNLSSGSYVYCTPGILISPSTPTNPVILSGTSQVDYIAGNEIQLKDGFSSNPTGTGFFHAYNDLSGYDVLMEPQNGQVPDYGKVEFTLRLPTIISSYIDNFTIGSSNTPQINPFDPEHINIEATFTAPDGITTKKVYGFYYKGFEYNNLDVNSQPTPATRWVPTGDEAFLIRFSPDQIGLWKCSITVEYLSSSVSQPDFTFCDIEFSCFSSSNKGYVEVGNNGYLKFGKTDDSFFAIGAYMGWANHRYDHDPSTDPTLSYVRAVRPVEYDDYMKQLDIVKSSGGNYVRMILAPQSWRMEWEELGNYYDRLPHGWELDRVVEWAEENNVYLNIAMMHAVELMDFDLESGNTVDPLGGNWNDNPYKTILSYQGDATRFFTESDARKYYKKYLRYFIARWGYSTHIAKFELGNEMSAGGCYTNNIANPCLKYDPYRGIFGTSSCSTSYSVPSQFQFQPDYSSGPNSQGDYSLLPSSVTGNTFAQEFSDWNHDMAGYIKNDLEAQQLVSNSYFLDSWDFPRSDDATNLDANISTICMHSYMTHLNNNLLRAQTVKDHKNLYSNKPFMFEELAHGYLVVPPGVVGPNQHNDVEMHNSSWAMCFSGAFGTMPVIVPSPGWPSAVHTSVSFQENIPAIASFFDGVDFESYDYAAYTEPTGPNDTQLAGTMNSQPLEKFILSSDDQAMGWIHLRRWYWAIPDNPNDVCQYNENNSLHYYHQLDPGNGVTPPPVNNQILTIPVGYNYNSYTIEWFDTHTGASLGTASDQVTPFMPREVHFIIPTLGAPVNDFPGDLSYRPDIAFKLYPSIVGEFRSEGINLSENIGVMPNPSNGEFTVSIQSTLNANPNLYLMDVSGRIIYTQSISIQEGFTQIQISKPELGAGVYFISVDCFDDPIKIIITK